MTEVAIGAEDLSWVGAEDLKIPRGPGPQREALYGASVGGGEPISIPFPASAFGEEF